MGKSKRKKQVAEYELLPPCEMSGMPQQEDVIPNLKPNGAKVARGANHVPQTC